MLKNKVLSVHGVKISLTGPNEDDRIRGLPLKEKEKIAQEVISTAISGCQNPYVLFDGCKESLVALHLVRQICNLDLRFPVLHIDTSVRFKEIYQYLDKMSRLWRFDLVTERNEEALRTLKIAENPADCCKQLKADALKYAVKKHHIDCLITGARDETLKTGVFVSERDDYIEVNPLLFYTDRDLSECIKTSRLPYCSLYDKGYRHIDCTPCTEPVEAPKLSSEDRAEIDKKLKALGYLR